VAAVKVLVGSDVDAIVALVTGSIGSLACRSCSNVASVEWAGIRPAQRE
jgi:hypothetical protein